MKNTLMSAALMLISVFGFADTDKIDIYVDAEVLAAFTELDTAGEGFITLAEAQAHEELAAVFTEVDLNGDGVITLDEFNAFMVN